MLSLYFDKIGYPLCSGKENRVKKSPRHTDINLPRNDRLPITCKYLWLTLKIQSAEIIFSYSAATQALTP